MKLLHNNPYSAHQEILLLLPWYVNKTLRGSELKRAEAHLNVCITCKREIASLQKLSLMVNQPSSFDSAEQASFAQLKKRLHNAYLSSPKPTAQVVSIEARSNRTKRPALTHWPLSRSALALAAVLVLSLIIPSFMRIDTFLSQDYRTLSEGGQATTNPNEMHIVFADNTTPQQINSILAQISGQIVDRPSEQAVYTVRSQQAHSKEEIQDLLTQLRKNPQVIFAEPAYALLSPTPAGSIQK